MAKKQVAVSLRKPPPPSDLQAVVIQHAAGAANDESPRVDAFVGAAKTSDAPGTRTLTVRLPESVVERLLAYCRLHERELDEVVAEILARHLAAQRPSTFSLDSAMQWVRAQLTVVGSLRTRVLQFAGW